MTDKQLSASELEELERKFDPETAFRKIDPVLGVVVSTALVAMSAYHFYASGFGLIREVLHRGIHLSFTLGLVFLLFGVSRHKPNHQPAKAWYLFDGVSFLDIACAVAVVAAALYLPLLPPEALASRVSNPSTLDVFMGSVLLVLTLEASRRSVGAILPIIAVVFILFA
ncbi:MAG: TRAP transporter permease, partial [Alphaproteobacteria bacterium]